MAKLDPSQLISYFNTLPPEMMMVLILVVSFGSILILLRLFGESGLYLFVSVAVITANIQVLKAVQFSIFSAPVQLGTVLFSATYLCTDILAEHYGTKSAQRAVFLGFFALLLFNIIMVITLGYRPLTPAEATGDWAMGMENHTHMQALFVQSPALFVAGMTAYLISQTHDVWVYWLLGDLTKGKHLWLRNNVSTILSTLIDNTVFSILAWVVFAPIAVDWHTLVFNIILGTYVLRLIVALLDTPFIYLSKYCLPKEKRARQNNLFQPQAQAETVSSS